MKALSLTQAWASLVVEGFKTYETRSWSTRFRGPLTIHASKGFPRWAKLLMGTDEYDGDTFIRDALNRDPDDLPLGAFIGTVILMDCQPTLDVLGSETVFISQAEHAFGDWADERFAWKLDCPTRFQHPIPIRGSLGLWEIPSNINLLSTGETS